MTFKKFIPPSGQYSNNSVENYLAQRNASQCKQMTVNGGQCGGAVIESQNLGNKGAEKNALMAHKIQLMLKNQSQGLPKSNMPQISTGGGRRKRTKKRTIRRRRRRKKTKRKSKRKKRSTKRKKTYRKRRERRRRQRLKKTRKYKKKGGACLSCLLPALLL